MTANANRPGERRGCGAIVLWWALEMPYASFWRVCSAARAVSQCCEVLQRGAVIDDGLETPREAPNRPERTQQLSEATKLETAAGSIAACLEVTSNQRILAKPPSP